MFSMCFLYSTAKCISMPCAKPVPCRTFRSVQNVRGDTWSARPAHRPHVPRPDYQGEEDDYCQYSHNTIIEPREHEACFTH